MIYDRKSKKYINEKTNSALSFLYNNLIGRFFLFILTRRWVSKLGAIYLRSPLSKGRIKKMIKKHKIDLSDYEISKYKSFNEFFMRRKKTPLKGINKNENILLAPADSRLTVHKIDDETCLNIKNSKYTVEELLQDSSLAQKYQGGYCLVYRLCVDDYHHYYYIDDAKVISKKKINGVLHTVQPIAFKKHKVFVENAREYNVLESKNFGTIIQMEVGALLVGKICNEDLTKVKRGDEKGHFEFGGSTVVLMIEKDKVVIDKDILENSAKDIETKVSLFDSVGRKM